MNLIVQTGYVLLAKGVVIYAKNIEDKRTMVVTKLKKLPRWMIKARLADQTSGLANGLLLPADSGLMRDVIIVTNHPN